MSKLDEHLAQIVVIRPDLQIDRVDFNQEGMINDVVTINGEYAFRFPKSDWARQTLAQESRLIDDIRDRVTIPLPELILHGDSFASYRWLRGSPLTREYLHSLDEELRRSVLRDFGSFLRILHGIPVSELGGVGQSEAARSRDDWISFYEQVQEVLFPLMFVHQRRSVESLFAPIVSGSLSTQFSPVLIHGDIAPYHILVDPETTKLTGVIDFGVSGLGDPAVDISLLLYNYGASMVDEIGLTYPLTPELLDRSRFWAGTLELQWALTGLRENDQSLMVAHIGSFRGYT